MFEKLLAEQHKYVIIHRTVHQKRENGQFNYMRI